MIIFYIALLFSITGDLLTYFLSGLYTNWVYFWFPIIGFIGFFLAFFILLVLYMIIRYAPVNLNKEVTKIDKCALWLVVQSCQMLLLIFGARIKTSDERIIPHDEKYLVVSNHISGFDHIAILAHLCQGPLLSISKKEVEHYFIVGKIMHKAGFIPLDRRDPFDAMRKIRTAANYISSDEASISISPEGTRSKDERVLPFHAGSFKIAQRARCPILVISLRNTDKIKYRCFRKITTVHIDFLKVISKEEYANKNTIEIAESVRNIIIDDLEKHK
ncbi:MAG: lysophospholipid acyltransferase family protein [Bacilli bacterium]|jgi:1-acyl-sn-glycerol-3-phosphate acyltransferase